MTKAAGPQGPGAEHSAFWSQGCSFQTRLAPLPEHPFLTSAHPSLLYVTCQRDPPDHTSEAVPHSHPRPLWAAFFSVAYTVF